MQLGLTVYRIYRSQNLTEGHLITGLDRKSFHLTIQCEIISVLEQDALIISGHYEDLADHAIKDRLHLLTLAKRDVNTIILNRKIILRF